MSNQNFYKSYYEQDNKQPNRPPRIPNYSNIQLSVQDINHPSPQLTKLFTKYTEISVFKDGIYISQRSSGWLRINRRELKLFFALKHISTLTWGFVPNRPLIIFFATVCIVIGGIIGYPLQTQQCGYYGRYYDCYWITTGVGLVIGAVLGLIISILIMSLQIEYFRRFGLIIRCDGNEFEIFTGRWGSQNQIIRIVEVWRSLKYYELTLQTKPNVNQPNNQNPPTQTGYPNAPKG